MWIEWRNLQRLAKPLQRRDSFKIAGLGGLLLMGDRLDAPGIVGCRLIFVSMTGVQMLPLLSRTRRG